ncbi:hypothetical protein EJB05_35654, partial [Eragrostis curvula]
MEVKIKADKLVIIVSAAVGSLGLLGAILGFAAEGSFTTETALGLGICAAIFMLAAQITVTVAGVRYKSRAVPSETKKIVGVVCGVVSWILAVLAFALLLRGAFSFSGLCAGGAVLTLAATALGITSFIMLRGQPVGEPNKPAGEQPSSVATVTGQAQISPAAAAGAPHMVLQQPPYVANAMGHQQFPSAAAAGAPQKPELQV